MRASGRMIGGVLAGLAVLAAAAPELGEEDRAVLLESMQRPRFAADGRLQRPDDFGAWRFVGSSFGLGYLEGFEGDTFKNVFLQPEAVEHYQLTGEFPEGAMLAMAIHESTREAEPRGGGVFAGELVSLELAVKDSARYSSGWAYFGFEQEGQAPSASPAPQSSGCNQCHAQHGADDNVFVQFYPELRAAFARRHGER